jgi:hypothetical protein
VTDEVKVTLYILSLLWYSQDSWVSVVMGYGLGECGSISSKGKIFCSTPQ